MPYAIRQKQRSEQMNGHESLLFDSLRPYCFEPEDTSDRDFVPTAVLYDTYRRYVQENYGRSAEILNPTQFGVALRRVFGVEPHRKTRRTCQGKHQMGYIHVRGPGSAITHAQRGNPSFGHEHSITQTAGAAPQDDGFLAAIAQARAAAAEAN